MAIKKRNNGGRMPEKRTDTLVRTIEKKYQIDFGVRSDMKLGNFLKKQGLPSLSKLLKTNKERR